jgi:hypothetical protein
VAPPSADYSALNCTTCQAFYAVFSALFEEFTILWEITLNEDYLSAAR